MLLQTLKIFTIYVIGFRIYEAQNKYNKIINKSHLELKFFLL